MGKQSMSNLCQWKKQQLVKLMEISDLTGQLAEAVERRDQESVNLLLTMRGEPIQQAQELERQVQEYLPTLPEEEAGRCHELLAGEPARTEEEELLAVQVAKNRRILEQIRKLDEKTSVMLGGKRSFYEKYRT